MQFWDDVQDRRPYPILPVLPPGTSDLPPELHRRYSADRMLRMLGVTKATRDWFYESYLYLGWVIYERN